MKISIQNVHFKEQEELFVLHSGHIPVFTQLLHFYLYNQMTSYFLFEDNTIYLNAVLIELWSCEWSYGWSYGVNHIQKFQSHKGEQNVPQNTTHY